MAEDDSWKAADFRNKVILKFEEKIQQMEQGPARTAKELEERVRTFSINN